VPFTSIPSTLLELDASISETIPAADVVTTPPPAGARSGQSRYEIVDVLGEGGMGRVDRVHDRDLLRDVAAKRLLPELRGQRGLVDQFLWEARVTAYLDHPNIVPVHELGATPDGEVFFTMKLARGATLEDELAKKEEGDLALSRRLRTFVKVCDAVAFAHARGVLHRDLKPANVLVGEYGEVLVSDWGLAVPLETAGEDLRNIVPKGLSRRSAGTPMYMSPEQARGDALDARSDIYTLGAILYELASFARPVEGDSLAAVLSKVTRGEIVPVATAKPGISTALAAVVSKAMALEPSERYATAKDLADDIETVLDGRTPVADRANVLKQAARYYVSRDPVFGKMRVVHIDMWIISSTFQGVAVGCLLSGVLGRWCWVVLAVGLVLVVPPTRAWLRLRREGSRPSA